MTPHLIHPALQDRQVSVALVGCGGSGSQVLTGLARLDRALRALGHPGGLAVTAWDPDRVSEANVGRQLFAPADVGHYKSIVLTHRVNLWYGLSWKAEPQEYTAQESSQIVVSCVDTAKARREIGGLMDLRYNRPLYWLDLGNREQDGQVILGELSPQRVQVKDPDGTWNRVALADRQPKLPTVLELFPELRDETQPEDDRPSCSLAEALETQDLFVNQAVATWALQLLWRLFRDGQLESHGYFINLAAGRVAPLPVPQAVAAKPERKRERKAA